MSDIRPEPFAFDVLIPELRGDDAAGARDALTIVYRAYVAPLATFAYGYVQARDVAEDIVQDAFMQLWHRRRQLTPQTNLRAYLYRAVRNTALNALRHDKRSRALSDRGRAETIPLGMSEGVGPPDVVAERAHLDAAVQQAIDTLPSRTREAFLLIRHHGMSYAEAADLLGVSPKTIEHQIGAALRALRSAIGTLIDR